MYRSAIYTAALALCGTAAAVISASTNQVAASGSKVLFDFRNASSLEDWTESSDTVRVVGMSKASFVLQKSQLFSRAVLFTMLNPQPNGACFAGFWNRKETHDLSGYEGLEVSVRQQGDAPIQKVVLYHNGEQEASGTCSYEVKYNAGNNTEFRSMQLPFSAFEGYKRGRKCPNPPPLNTANITSVGLQVAGGVHEDYKQSGVSSLEINYIRAY